MSTGDRRESATVHTDIVTGEQRLSCVPLDEEANVWIIHPIRGKGKDLQLYGETSDSQITSQCIDESNGLQCASNPHFTISLGKRIRKTSTERTDPITQSLINDLKENKDAIKGLETLRDDPANMNRPRYGANIALGFKWYSLFGELIDNPSGKQAFLLRTDSTLYLEIYEPDNSLSRTPSENRVADNIESFRTNLTARIRMRFIGKGNQDIDPIFIVLEQLCYLILDEESRLLSKAGTFLRECDERIAGRLELDKATELQGRLGIWRGQLHVMNGWCTRYIHNVKVVEDKYKENTPTKDDKSDKTEFTDLLEDLEDFQRRISHLIQHTESTFSTLIGTINLIAAKVVEKLTWVAAAVVPFNLMVGFCGMNIQNWPATSTTTPNWPIFVCGVAITFALEVIVYQVVGLIRDESKGGRIKAIKLLDFPWRKQQRSEGLKINSWPKDGSVCV